MDSLSLIASGKLDIYEFLGISSDARASEIRSQYRRKALEVHPDKDPSPEAAEKFHTLSHIYEILNNDELRREYDRIRSVSLAKQRATDQASEQVKAFRQKLELAEKQHQKTQSVTPQNIEKLRDEGIRMRLELEKQVRKSPQGYVSYKLLGGPRIPVWDENSLTTCTVWWKRRSELDGMFTGEVIEELMSIFGDVGAVVLLPRNSSERHDKAQVGFKSLASAQEAANHDYRKSASRWDGTRVRKLASLLRGCKLSSTDGSLRQGPLQPAVQSFLNV